MALAYKDTEALLIKLGDTADRVVVVGGQAVNFWAWWFQERVPALADEQPFTSKDVDVWGRRKDVPELARRLGGEARVAGFDDVHPQRGTVTYKGANGTEHTIDVMGSAYGFRIAQEIDETAIPIEYETAEVPSLFSGMHRGSS